MFKRGQASALIVVPKGFQDAVLAGKRAELGVLPEPDPVDRPRDRPQHARDDGAHRQRPVRAGRSSRSPAVRALVRRRTGADRRRGGARSPASSTRPGSGWSGLQGLSDLTVGVQRPGQSAAQTGFGNDPGQFFAYVFPGLVIFGLMFIAQSLAMRLMRDRLRGPPAAHRDHARRAGGRHAGRRRSTSWRRSSCCWSSWRSSARSIFRIQLRDPLALAAIGVGFAVFAAGPAPPVDQPRAERSQRGIRRQRDRARAVAARRHVRAGGAVPAVPAERWRCSCRTARPSRASSTCSCTSCRWRQLGGRLARDLGVGRS